MVRQALTLLASWALIAEAAFGIPIVGRILDSEGEPATTAEVRLEPIAAPYERARWRMEGKAGPPAVASTRTRADGTFELVAPSDGMWKVVATAPGMLPVEYRLVPLVESTVLPSCRLSPAHTLEVQLKDSEGNPVSGRVGVLSSGRRQQGWWPSLRLATADTAGTARVLIGRGERAQLEVLAEGHALRVLEGSGRRALEIVLPPGVPREVRVSDRSRRPRAGVVAFQGSALLPLAVSDAEGRLSLVLQAEDPPPVQLMAVDNWHGSFELDPSDKAMKELRLDPPATMTGRVVETTNGDPVPHALVWAVRGELARADGQGRYALDIGAYTSRWIQAVAPGYQRGFQQIERGVSSEVPRIVLDPSAELGGRVVDGDAQPIAGVAVELSLQPDHSTTASRRVRRQSWRGRTSSNGVFRVAGLPAELGYLLGLERSGFARRIVEIDPLEPFERRLGIEVVLEPGRVAVGRVIDELDQPIAGAEVVLRVPSAERRFARTGMRRAEDEASMPRDTSDSEGQFEIHDLAAGRYDLAVRAVGFAPVKVPGVRVPDFELQTDLGEVLLVPGAAIEGTVSDAEDQPIVDAEVKIEGLQQGIVSRSSSETRSDARGGFALADLIPEEPLTLVVSKEGYGTYSQSGLRPPAEALKIVLWRAGSLSGRVVDEYGQAIAKASINVSVDHRAGGQPQGYGSKRSWSRSDEDGRFTIPDIEPGIFSVNVAAKGFRHDELSGVEIPSGELVELEIVLRKGARIEGTVTQSDGEPVANASITVTERAERIDAFGERSSHGRSGAEGRYQIDGVPVGPASLWLRLADGREHQQQVEVRAGTNVVDLEVERGFEIRGQVVSAAGGPVAAATLSLQRHQRDGDKHTRSGRAESFSDARGAFALKGSHERGRCRPIFWCAGRRLTP